eukprot:3756063-Ditylum_brightwellii.AAC.1
MFMANSTWSYISFAVKQCAYHSQYSTELHAKYLRQIGQYLISNCTKDMILKSLCDPKLKIDCFIDADFVDPCKAEDIQNPHFVKSRTG